MSKLEKLLVVFLMLIFTIPIVNAGTIWPFGYFPYFGFFSSRKALAMWCIIVGFVVEIGFVQYFTKASYPKSALVSLCMSLASGLFGVILAVLVGIIVFTIAFIISEKGFWFIVHAFNIQVNTDTGEALFFTAIFILAIISAVFINPLIEGFIVKLMLKLKIKKTYKWLLAANVVSIVLCLSLIAITH